MHLIRVGCPQSHTGQGFSSCVFSCQRAKKSIVLGHFSFQFELCFFLIWSWSIPVGASEIRCSTRVFAVSKTAATDHSRHESTKCEQDSKFRQKLGISSPRKLLLIPGFQNSKSNTFMFSLLLFSPKDFASQKRAEIYGDVPKRLKGPHSKCGRSAQTDARVRISPSPPPKKPVIKPIMGFFLIPFSKSK